MSISKRVILIPSITNVLDVFNSLGYLRMHVSLCALVVVFRDL